MSAQSNERNPVCIPLQLGSPDADDAIIAGAYFYAHRKFKVTDAVLVNGAAIAASDTDYAQVSLKNGSDVVAELDTRAAHENGLDADVGKAMNIDSDNQVIDKESTLTVAYDETDTGANVALTSAVLLIYGYWIESA